ncbi:MAG: MarR family transcriptional regulator [Acholeplasmataceae bacterium]
MNNHFIGKNFFITTNKLKRYLDKNHQKTGIYLGQARILRFLFLRKNEKTYQKDIENHFQIRAGTVTGLLDGLINLDLIERIDSTKDKRKKFIKLTNLGKDKAEEAFKTILSFETNLDNLLNDEEKNNLLIIFNKINNWIDQMEELN